VRKADNLTPFCAAVTKSGNLNFLEPSGPLQACNGAPLPLFNEDLYAYVCFITRYILLALCVCVCVCGCVGVFVLTGFHFKLAHRTAD